MSNAKTVLKSLFNAYPKNIQDSLIVQGFEVIEDPVTTDETLPELETVGALNLIDDIEDDEDTSDLFINIHVTKGEKRYKLTFASLDSDFVRYTDKEHTTKNPVREAIVDAVNTVGFEKAAEAITFTVELTKKGEHGAINLLD